MTQEPFSIDSVLRHCAENRQRTLISVAKRTSAYCILSDTLSTLAVLETLPFSNISTLRVNGCVITSVLNTTEKEVNMLEPVVVVTEVDTGDPLVRNTKCSAEWDKSRYESRKQAENGPP